MYIPSKNFEISSTFPFDQLLMRQESKNDPKCIYFVSSGVKKLMLSKNNISLHVVNSGVKTFSRCSDKIKEENSDQCTYRIQQDSLDHFKSYIGARVIDVTLHDLRLCLSIESQRHSFDEYDSKDQWEQQSSGSLIFSFISSCGKFKAAISVWKGKSTIQTMINAAERDSLLNQIEFLTNDSAGAR